MMNNRIYANLAACLIATLVAACGHSRVEENYGDAVRSMIEGQYYDPAAAANPSRDAVEGTDGQRMEAVMEAHRAPSGSAESVNEPIVISVGQ